MISYLLIAGIAYGIAYWISSTGMAIWRAVVSFLIALVVGWLGGTLVSVFLISTFLAHDTAATTLNLLGSGFWLATTGAGIGVYRARYKLRTGQDAPVLKFPKWIALSALVLFIIGIVAAVALPAYQDYAKRQAVSAQQTESVLTPPAEVAVNWDEFVPFTGTLDGQPAAQKNAARANPFDQFDSNTARPVNDDNNRPFTYEEAIAPKTQSAVEQEHYRRIYAAHPDADAIHNSPDFQTWLAKYPTYQRIVAKGTTQEIIEMFTAYKNQH